MANGKSDRKRKVAIKLLIVIIFIIVYVFGVNLREIIIPYVEEQKQMTGSTFEEHEQQNNLNEVDGELVIHMIDVGQADSFLLVQGDQIALIDCGTKSGGETVVEYLQNLGVTKINYLFGTHPHDDHMGGMYDVITQFEVEKIILPEVDEEITTSWYMKLMNEILNNKSDEEHEGKYEVEYAKVGNVYNLGEAFMKVIGPISQPTNNKNNYSTVLKVSFGEMDVIMTGDAEKKVEREIIESGENLDAEILKVGHHGSDTSSSEEFLDAVNPDYALISAGVGNKFDHPIESVMETLKIRKIKVYRTDECGTVVLNITTDDVSFSCEPGDYVSGIQLKERSKQ